MFTRNPVVRHIQDLNNRGGMELLEGSVKIVLTYLSQLSEFLKDLTQKGDPRLQRPVLAR